MLEVFKHNNGHLEDDLSIATAEKGSWINVVNPDSDDLQIVSMVTEIPTDVLKMALDTEERSRVESRMTTCSSSSIFLLFWKRTVMTLCLSGSLLHLILS